MLENNQQPPMPEFKKAPSVLIENKFNSPTAKILLIGILSLLLLIPSSWIRDLVSERRSYRDTAASEVQAMWGGPQTVGSPLLVVPYVYDCESVREYTENGISKFEKIVKQCGDFVRIYPDQLTVQGDFPSSERPRGIYQIPLYQAELKYQFNFATPNWTRLDIDPQGLQWDRAYFALTLQDTRGLKSSPVLQWNDQQVHFEYEQIEGKPWDNALIARISNAQNLFDAKQNISLNISLNGSDSFYLLPLAREAFVSLKSDWKSPSFSGMFLPETRNVSNDGFNAKWSVMSLNHGEAMLWRGDRTLNTSVSVGFKQMLTVDHYSMTDRALKYVILFIALTFILCYFAERLTGANINPMQYLLIGLSLLLFYTLLLAISESIGFSIAYALATVAITAQIGFFVRMVLKDYKAAWISIALLNALYGFLFVLLRLEDLSLLAGSIGLFIILGALMYISVKVNSKNSFAKEKLSEIDASRGELLSDIR